jgi:hypothetical protein
MKTYFVHPADNQHIDVTTRHERGGKRFEFLMFIVDLPGRWFEDKYNCHVDGCDYPCDTLEDALERGAYFYSEPHTFVNVNERYGEFRNAIV